MKSLAGAIVVLGAAMCVSAATLAADQRAQGMAQSVAAILGSVGGYLLLFSKDKDPG